MYSSVVKRLHICLQQESIFKTIVENILTYHSAEPLAGTLLAEVFEGGDQAGMLILGKNGAPVTLSCGVRPTGEKSPG